MQNFIENYITFWGSRDMRKHHRPYTQGNTCRYKIFPNISYIFYICIFTYIYVLYGRISYKIGQIKKKKYHQNYIFRWQKCLGSAVCEWL